MTLCINFFGGPNIGKSALSHGVTAALKLRHLDVEMATEAAKDLLREKRQQMVIENQISVAGIQWDRLHSLVGEAEFVVCDGPILLGSVYAPPSYPPAFHDLLIWCHHQIPSVNFLLTRHTAPFQPRGRRHDAEQSARADHVIQSLLDRLLVPYIHLAPNATPAMVLDVLTKLGHLTA